MVCWYAQCALHVELQGELRLEYATAREVEGHVFCGCTKNAINRCWCSALLHNDRKNLFWPLPPPPPAATPENGGDVLVLTAGIISMLLYVMMLSFYIIVGVVVRTYVEKTRAVMIIVAGLYWLIDWLIGTLGAISSHSEISSGIIWSPFYPGLARHIGTLSQLGSGPSDCAIKLSGGKVTKPQFIRGGTQSACFTSPRDKKTPYLGIVMCLN
jgi:hypothetical protein